MTRNNKISCNEIGKIICYIHLVVTFLNMDEKSLGLSSQQAEILLEKYGPNAFNEKKENLSLKIFKLQFKNLLLLLIILVIIISYLLGESLDIILLAIVAILNIGIGFVQEYSSSKTLEKLRD